jgi:hypothetical protein
MNDKLRSGELVHTSDWHEHPTPLKEWVNSFEQEHKVATAAVLDELRPLQATAAIKATSEEVRTLAARATR